MTGMEQHPDIVELRARYERAAARPAAQLAEGLVFLTGLYLAISPWVVGFFPLRGMAVNNVITGIALALIGAGLAWAYGRTHGMAWVAPVIGVWAIISPWVIRGGVAATTATIASNVATGAVAVVVGLAAMSIAMMSRH